MGKDVIRTITNVTSSPKIFDLKTMKQLTRNLLAFFRKGAGDQEVRT